jgi:hypothetical protein
MMISNRFTDAITQVFNKKAKLPPMVDVCIINQRHANSWFKKNQCYNLYRLDGFYSNVPNVDSCKVGAARIVNACDVEEL